MKYYIICCNDQMEYVCLSENAAKLKMKELKYNHKKKVVYEWRQYDIDTYENVFYWHIHEVSGESNISDEQIAKGQY